MSFCFKLTGPYAIITVCKLDSGYVVIYHCKLLMRLQAELDPTHSIQCTGITTKQNVQLTKTERTIWHHFPVVDLGYGVSVYSPVS